MGDATQRGAIPMPFDQAKRRRALNWRHRIVVGSKEPETARPVLVHETAEFVIRPQRDRSAIVRRGGAVRAVRTISRFPESEGSVGWTFTWIRQPGSHRGATILQGPKRVPGASALG